MKIFRSCTLVLLLAFAATKGPAQNLVLNPSFENINVSCSGFTGAGYINLVDWDNPDPTDTCSTPDWFSTCLTGFFPTHAPNSWLGNQMPRTGDAYAGFITYDATTASYREYVEGKLSSPLVAGQTYCVKFYVSLADTVPFAADRLGVYFSNTFTQFPISHCVSRAAIPVTPQLEWTGATITDEVNWKKLQWTYTAVGGEQFLTIGNFYNNSGTTQISVGGSLLPNPFAYYFIDDVSVTPGPCCTINLATSQTTNCSGTASITVNPSGASAPYTYNWSNGSTTSTASGLAPGTYTVTITDNTGCTQDTSYTVAPVTAFTAAVTTSPTCPGSNSGIASVFTTGPAAPPYTYSWSGGAGSTATVTGLAAGTYTVTVTNGVGCSATASGTVATGTAATFSVAGTATNANCGPDGTATATVTGGSGAFNYSWNTSPQQTTPTATGLPAGTYIVAVTDVGGTPTPFYTEDFTSGGTTWTLTNNGPGANGAQANKWLVNNSNPLCTGGSGGNYLHVACNTGGFPPICSQTDAHYEPGIPIFADNSTDKFASSPVISTLGKTNITLKFTYQSNGQSTMDYGQVRLSNDGGTTWTDLPTQYSGVTTCTQASVAIPVLYENIANFKIAFRWINNNDNTGNDSPFAIDDVVLESTGGGSCAVTATVVVGSSSTLSVTTSKTDAACGTNNGTATATPTGGSGTYTYNWSTSPSQTTQTATGLAPGTYTVTISDGSCSMTSTVTIMNGGGAAVTLSSMVNVACFGASTGSINALASGGPGPYDFVWSNGSGTIHTDTGIAAATSITLSGLPAGVYTVTVTDTSGCFVNQGFTITQPASALSVTPSSITNATCGSSNGAATVTASGGTGPGYTYSWSPAGGTSPTASSLTGGSYVVTVTDANSCTATTPVVINNTGGPTVSVATTNNVTCNGANTGSASVSATGGSGTYTYSWSGGAGTSASASNLAAGTYTVNVSDGSCSNAVIVTITQPAAIAASVATTASNCGSPTGAATVTASGGTGALSYSWSNSAGTTATVNNLSSGTYTVTITDAFGCTQTASGVVGSVGGPTANAGNSVLITAGDNTTLMGSGTSGATFSWSPAATLSCSSCQYPVASPTQTTTYTLTVTQGGCSATDEVTVYVDVECGEFFIPTAFSPNNDGANDVLYVMGNCILNMDFTIFDRWGEKVFESSDPSQGWDGTLRGKKLDAGVFVYYFYASINGIEVKKHGNITLVK